MNAANPALSAQDKWGEAADAGFQVLPDLLLKHQAELGLSTIDLTVLLNLTMHWWYADQRPFPRSATVAARMGVDQRTVQRSLIKLKELGFVERQTEALPNGEFRQVCDLSGLRSRLINLAKGDPIYLARIERRFGAM